MIAGFSFMTKRRVLFICDIHMTKLTEHFVPPVMTWRISHSSSSLGQPCKWADKDLESPDRQDSHQVYLGIQ